MVNYYSQDYHYFNQYPKFNTKLNALALDIEKISNSTFNFKRWTINKLEKSCPCRVFLKASEFVYKYNRGRKKGCRYKKASSALMVDED